MVGAPAAHADAVDDAVQALRSGSVYEAPGVTEPEIDEAAVTSAIGTRPIKVAVLPADDYGSTSQTFDAAERIGRALAPDSPLTVGVVAGRSFNAASSALCSGAASTAAEASVNATRARSEEHTSELQSRQYLVCRLLLEKKKKIKLLIIYYTKKKKQKKK